MPRNTRRSTFREDLKNMSLSLDSAQTTVLERRTRRTLAADERKRTGGPKSKYVGPWRRNALYTVVQKNALTLVDYNYDPVQSILIIFSKLFANDHKVVNLVVKFSTSPHICCHYTL